MPEGKKVDFELIFEPDGTIVNPWWTKESHEFTKKMGVVPLKEYETVAANPWCG